MTGMTKQGLIEATAMALYIFMVSPHNRAKKLYEHFDGACAEMQDMIRYVDRAFWATEMPFPTVVIYMQHAMDRYGEEAAQRVEQSLHFHQEIDL